MQYENIEIVIKDFIAVVALNRVEKLNALNAALAKDIADAVNTLSAMDDVRVIVLKSNARAFCAGIDLGAASSRDKSNPVRNAFIRDAHYSFACCNILEDCKKPVIAAINGMCVGAGLDIACACDVRLCTEDAKFSLREAAVGLVADMGALQRIPLIVGQGFAREMVFTARFYSARDAERMGLVNGIYPGQSALIEGTMQLAAEIAANAPIAVEETKDVLNYSRNKSIQDGMAYAKQKDSILFGSEDMAEAARAFREKRKPQFRGR